MSEWNPEDGPEPTAEERRDAAQLQRALDGDTSARADPELLATAALLRAAPLRDAAKREIFERSLPLKRRPWRFALAVAAAVMIAFGIWTRIDVPQTEIAAPDAALLKVQAEAARGQDRDALGAAMAAYRRTLIAPPKLRDVAAVYARVDAALARSDTRSATEALEGFVAAKRFEGVSEREHKALVQDAYVRLAEIALDNHDGAAALATIDRGVALGVEQDVFGVNLLLARAAAFAAVGNEEKEAAAVHEAMLLSDALLTATLGEQE